MCGRFSLITDIQALLKRFEISHTNLLWAPRYNIAPTQNALVITSNKQRSLQEARWSLVPHWSKTPATKPLLINARAETLWEKPTFKGLLSTKRCLVPADGFYEWIKTPASKIPMRISLKSRNLFSFAGLWDEWQQGDELLHTFTIITTQANPALQPIHERMPVILTKEHEDLWLDPSIQSRTELEQALIPYPLADLQAYQVSQVVNSSKTDSPECIKPV